mgnify:FL=1
MHAAQLGGGCAGQRQLARQVSRLYDAHLARAGLRTTQYALLSHITKLGPLRLVDLASAMELNASTLTRNLRPLLAAGWVELSAGPDQRSRLVCATDAGRTKRTEAQRCWRNAQDELNQRLGLDQVATLHALLDGCSALLQHDPLPADPPEVSRPGAMRP